MEETFLIQTDRIEALGAYIPLYIVKIPRKPLYEEKTGKQDGAQANVTGRHFHKYKNAFWVILGPDLVQVFNASFDSGCLPFSQKGALISLVF